ncbi:MAG: hypothetical protein JWP11_2759 [Frankiales bacterium]|nr:hypothetical protein [Frankiales bacterium]
MRLPALLRPPPSLSDVELALLTELGRYADGERHVPNAWGIQLSARDCRRRAGDLPRWSSALAERLVDEHAHLGLPASGLVTVSFSAAADLIAGTFRVSCGIATGQAVVVRRKDALPGRPRLVLPAGGTARQGSPRAAGIDREVQLPVGTFVIGRDQGADLRLQDPTVSPRHVELEVTADGIRLRDLGTLNGTCVDGVPVASVDLRDGNRIELGDAVIVFHRDPVSGSGRP